MSTRSPVPDRRTITDLLADRTRSHPGHVAFDVQQVALSTWIGPMVTVCSGPMSTRRPA